MSNISVFLPLDAHRRVSVGTDQAGRVMMVSAYYQKQTSKSRMESEVVTAIFAPDGTLRRGTRTFHVATKPPSTKEDKGVPLSPKDAEAAIKLGASIAKRCQ